MLFGERTRLRAFDRRDIPLAVEVFNDPAVRAQVLTWLPLSVAREEKIFEELDKSTTALTFVIEDRGAPHRSIGVCGLHDVDWKNGNARTGICLLQADWNKGFGTDALRSLITFAFDEMGLHRIELDVLSSNLRGIKSYEKIGFHRRQPSENVDNSPRPEERGFGEFNPRASSATPCSETAPTATCCS